MRALGVAVALTLSASVALAQGRERPAPPRAPAAGIELNFEEPVSLGVLTDYVGARLGLNLVYGESLDSKMVTIKGNDAVPESALLPLLDSALAAHDLALVSTGDPSWYTITSTRNLTRLSDAAHQHSPDQGEMHRHSAIVTRLIELRFLTPAEGVKLLEPFLSTDSANATPVPDQPLLVVTDFVGNMARIERMVELIDRPRPERIVHPVEIRHATPEAISEQVTRLLTLQSGAAESPLDVLTDERTRQLILVGTQEEIDQALGHIEALDVPLTPERSPVRFYPLANAVAGDVLSTLQSLTGSTRADDRPPDNALRTPGADPQSPDAPPTDAPADALPDAPTGEELAAPTTSAEPFAFAPDQLRSAALYADENTNSIIVVGDPGAQAIYEHLIRELDQRRAQVLVETTIVVLDTSDSFSLGIEVSSGFGGDPETVTFSSFGLSTRSEDDGGLVLTPSTGFNGAIFSPGVIEVIIKALQRDSRARIVSAPSILVYDNATGLISATNQEPVQSINASDTVATTSFSRFVEAGTSISVTPHISSGDYLNLEYSVELSDFAGDRVDTLPPPRIQNTLESTVTLPDGYTVVTGGITQISDNDSVTRVPILGELPGIDWLFQNRSDSSSEMTLFVFIRPTVLRDPEFRDIRSLSRSRILRAGIPPDYPTSHPLAVHPGAVSGASAE